MKEVNYLCYIPNIFNSDEQPKLYLYSQSKGVVKISPSVLLRSKDIIVSYEIEKLFNYFIPKNNDFNNNFIDLSHVYRLIVGAPYKGRKGQEPWSIWAILKKEYGELTFLKDLLNFIHAGSSLPKTKKIDELVEMFLKYLKKMWEDLQKKLTEKNEWERYERIERPVNNIFLKQQLIGIQINAEILNQKLNDIDNYLTKSAKTLRLNWNILDPGDYLSINMALTREGFSALSDADNSSYESLLELYAKRGELPKYLKMYRDNYKNKNILLRLGAINSNRVFPEYKTLGTVTGRILVESPNIQNIKSTNRGIFKPENDKVFLYPDYSQFEPGIMADDSKDEDLINDFNSGDIYLSLSERLFGNTEDRKYAKIIFLSFCYGMKIDRMIRLAADASGKPIREIEKSIKSFFGKYKKLNEWKENLMMELKDNGRIGTRLGCYRYRTRASKYPLNNEEKRWVISQRIQGTAALILKRVILRINKECPQFDILLPMHDALLLQVPKLDVKRSETTLTQIFIDEFMTECPAIKPRVTFDEFSKAINE
jgi:DNA polymerase I-like protein with 3'-5' exonuclease and polymerase domains